MRKFLVLSVLALAGCCNIVQRPARAAWVCGPYENTCAVAAALAAPFSDPEGPDDTMAKAYLTLLFPAILVDLPLDAVVDTVFLPWDLGWKLVR